MQKAQVTAVDKDEHGNAHKVRKAAFEAYLSAILGAPPSPAKVDAEYGAERALELVEIARQPDIAARLAILPGVVFPDTCVGELEALGHAALYLHDLHQAASKPKADGPASEDRKLGERVLAEAEGIRATLHKLLDYHFGEDALVAAELADFRGRRGALRAAATLARLATLARERSAVLSKDTKYWRPSLIADAERLASAVQATVLSLSEKDALELERRTYKLIEGLFNDLRATLAWLLRHEPSKVNVLPLLKKPAQRKTADA